jgi:hypothetical protein
VKLVEVGIDWVAEQANKEAAKYEAQFKQAKYDDSFWENGSPKYAGFEIVRWADGYENPASRLVCRFEYSKAEPRIVLIRPLHYSIPAAKTQVARIGESGSIASRTTIMISGAWLDKHGSLQQQELANASIALRNLKFREGSDNNYSKDVEGMVFGYFLAPPVSHDTVAMQLQNYRAALATHNSANTKDSSKALEKAHEVLTDAYDGGAFRISVVVTENDESKVKDYLIRFSDYITERKPDVVKAVKDATSDK